MPAWYYRQWREPIIPTPRSRREWTEKEESLLLVGDGEKCSVLAKRLGRSLEAVHRKRFRLGLTSK